MTNAVITFGEVPRETTMRQALASRDAGYDGVFVYGGVTTGVYCKTSCRSRPAKPENVRFFADTSAAELAGLRACKRCRPRGTHNEVGAFEAHVADEAPRPDLPLDLRGTAFQIRVWRFLLQMPSGKIVSYTELATGIGSPKAFRAAASACAANRIAVLVPCHRVLRGDGGLGGYRWGVERKRVLIDRERARSAS